MSEFQTFTVKQLFGACSGLEDKATACQMLVCYARELKEHFVEYAEQTVRLMVPMLKFYFHDGVRAAAAESLPCLIECAKIRGPQYVQEMWAYICPELIKVYVCFIWGPYLINCIQLLNRTPKILKAFSGVETFFLNPKLVN